MDFILRKIFWKVSDRACVLQIKLEEVVYKKSKTSPLISIINVYAPTSQQGDKYRGRPITTLPVVLNNDLSRLESSTYCLKTFKDIENLKKIAEQRDQWRILCTRIQKAAEAFQSDDYDAERR